MLWDLTVLEGKLGLNLLELGYSIRMCWRQVLYKGELENKCY